MQRLRHRRRHHAELLAEELAQVVHTERIRAVTAALVNEHRPAVARFAIRRCLDECIRGALRGVELAATDLEARLGDELERALAGATQAPPRLVEPGALLSLHELARRNVLDDPSRASCGRPIGAGDGSFRPMERIGDGLEVHPGVVGENEPKIGRPSSGAS